jgi:sulfur carrier protein ThiS
MELEIKLFSDFKCYAPGSENVFSISISSGVTVADALKALKIPGDIPKVTILNGRRADANTIIEPQSILVVFSPVSGG